MCCIVMSVLFDSRLFVVADFFFVVTHPKRQKLTDWSVTLKDANLLNSVLIMESE